ncbi:MarR family transcriptional regulator [Streptomyces griseosporeus]|uniref:MarR family transcriptional regulator n=1 Tax=Streptomyces griseosporeus TaxID=1910 RepID=UPI0036FA81FA
MAILRAALGVVPRGDVLAAVTGVAVEAPVTAMPTTPPQRPLSDLARHGAPGAGAARWSTYDCRTSTRSSRTGRSPASHRFFRSACRSQRPRQAGRGPHRGPPSGVGRPERQVLPGPTAFAVPSRTGGRSARARRQAGPARASVPPGRTGAYGTGRGRHERLGGGESRPREALRRGTSEFAGALHPGGLPSRKGDVFLHRPRQFPLRRKREGWAVRRRKVGPTVGMSTRERAFLTLHARVLAVIAREPDRRMRDIATECRTTERTVWNIVRDLETAGYISRRRDGRRLRYTVALDRALHHPAEAHLRVRHLVTFMAQARPQAIEGHRRPGNDAPTPARQGERPDQPTNAGSPRVGRAPVANASCTGRARPDASPCRAVTWSGTWNSHPAVVPCGKRVWGAMRRPRTERHLR